MLLEPLMEYRATKQILGHPQDPVLRAFFGPDTADDVHVDEHRAMNISACWAATNKLSGSLSSLPLKVYERTSGDGKREARDHIVWRLLHSRPNPDMASMPFRAYGISQQVNLGNAYAEIERTGSGKILGIWPIHYSRVMPCRDTDKKLYFEVKNNSGPESQIKPDDFLSVTNVLSYDGIRGRGVIDHASDSLRLARSTERHGLSYFSNGAKPGIVVKHPHRMSDEGRKNFRREWNELYQGPDNAGKMAILSDGGDIVQLEVSNEAAQYLETRQFSIYEIARWYNVPATMIGALDRATWSNAEQMFQEFVLATLLPLAVLWEQEFNYKLFSEAEREHYYCEHIFDGLLRGDALARAQAFQIQARNGAVTIDEWRGAENRNPLPDGDGSIAMASRDLAPVELLVNAEPAPVSAPVAPAKAPAEPPDDNAPQVRHSPKFILAHRSLMAQITGRLIRKEAKAIRSAANKPESFLSSMEAFYLEHELHFAAELIPSLRSALSILNPKLDAGVESRRIAKQHIDQARSELLEAAGVKPEQFKDAIETRVSAWEQTGADMLADAELSNLIGE